MKSIKSDVAIFWEYKALSKEDIKGNVEDFLCFLPMPMVSISKKKELKEREELTKSFYLTKELFFKILNNKVENCRSIKIRGWRVVVLDSQNRDIITMGYFDPETFGYGETTEKNFVKELVKLSPTSLPMFLGIGNTLDAEIEKAFKKGVPLTPQK